MMWYAMVQWEIVFIFKYFFLRLFTSNWLAIELRKNYVKFLVKHIRLMCVLVHLKRCGYTINKLFYDNKQRAKRQQKDENHLRNFTMRFV